MRAAKGSGEACSCSRALAGPRKNLKTRETDDAAALPRAQRARSDRIVESEGKRGLHSTL